MKIPLFRIYFRNSGLQKYKYFEIIYTFQQLINTLIANYPQISIKIDSKVHSGLRLRTGIGNFKIISDLTEYMHIPENNID